MRPAQALTIMIDLLHQYFRSGKKSEIERSDSGTIPGQIFPNRPFFAILFPV
jgi:hypothetical protein